MIFMIHLITAISDLTHLSLPHLQISITPVAAQVGATLVAAQVGATRTEVTHIEIWVIVSAAARSNTDTWVRSGRSRR